MNKNLHKFENLIRLTYKNFKHQPSPEVWEKIYAELLKKDAELKKRKLTGWKRTTIPLIFLLITFFIYETYIFKTNYSNLKNSSLRKLNNSHEQNNINQIKGKSNILQGLGEFYVYDSSGKKVRHNSISCSWKSTGKIKNFTAKIGKCNNLRIKQKILENSINNFRFEKPMSDLRYSSGTLLSYQGSAVDSSRSLNSFERLIKRQNVYISTLPDTFFQIQSNQPIIKIKTNKQTAEKETRGLKENINKSKTKSFKPYWSITGFTFTDWGQNRFDINQQQADNNAQQEETQVIQQGEKNKSSISIGITASFQFKKNWSVESGFIYLNSSKEINPQKIYAVRVPSSDISYKYITSSGYTYINPAFNESAAVGDSLDTGSGQLDTKYLSVPIFIKFKIKKNKFSLEPGGGLATNFLVSTQVQTEIEDSSTHQRFFLNKTEGIKRLYWELIFENNFSYEINANWSINFRPAFKYAVTPLAKTKNNIIITYPYIFIAGLGVSLRF